MRIVQVLLGLAACLAATRASADIEKAKSEYRLGTQLYNLAEYDKALERFKSAYLELPDSAFLFNIGQCQRQLGEYEAASKSYRAFLRESPTLPQQTRDEVNRLLSEMDKAAREARAKLPPPGMRPPGEPPKLSPEPAPPAGLSQPPAPVSTNVVSIQSEKPRRQPVYKKWWLWTAVAGVVAVGVGIGVGVALTTPSNAPRPSDAYTVRFP